MTDLHSFGVPRPPSGFSVRMRFSQAVKYCRGKEWAGGKVAERWRDKEKERDLS